MLKTSLRAFVLFALLIVSVATFAVDPVLPPKPTLTNPENGTTVDTNSPLLQWTYTGEDVDNFKVWVKDVNGVKVYSDSIDAVDACSGTACSASPGAGDIQFLNGVHTWRVIARNAEGKTKSDPGTFTINFPGSAVLLSPGEGSNVTANPTFVWGVVNAAEQYRVKVRPTGSTPTTNRYTSAWLDGTSVCAGEDCTHTFNPAIATGTYRWFVESRQVTFPNKSKSVKNNFTFGVID